MARCRVKALIKVEILVAIELGDELAVDHSSLHFRTGRSQPPIVCTWATVSSEAIR